MYILVLKLRKKYNLKIGERSIGENNAITSITKFFGHNDSFVVRLKDKTNAKFDYIVVLKKN